MGGKEEDHRLFWKPCKKPVLRRKGNQVSNSPQVLIR